MKPNNAEREFLIKSLRGYDDLSRLDTERHRAYLDECRNYAREIAYGFMVKGYKRGDRVLSVVADRNTTIPILLGCELSHIEMVELSREALKERVHTTLERGALRAVFVSDELDYEYVKEVCNKSGVMIDLFLVPDSDSVCDLRYLRMIGKSWEIKYKPFVDRAFRQLELTSLTLL